MIKLLYIRRVVTFPIQEDDTPLLLSLIYRRYHQYATIIVSQFEPTAWLDQIPIPVAVEAITDYLSAQAYKVIIQGNQPKRLHKH